VSHSDSAHLGPFSVSYSAGIKLKNGKLDFQSNGTVLIKELDIVYDPLKLILFRPEDAEFDGEIIDRAVRWHRQQQGNDVALAFGMKLNLLPLLHTTFNQTDEELALSHEVRLAELRDAGFDI
jgi:hypothetical protein